MAFSKSPIADTYSTEATKAAVSLDLRIDTDVLNFRFSPGMLNFHPIKSEDSTIAESRKQVIAGTVTVSGASSTPVRGTYVWEKSPTQIYYFVVDGTSIITSSTGLPGSWTAVNNLSTNPSTPVGFTEYIDSANVKKLIVVDGIEGYVFTSNAIGSKITDVDFPTPHVPFPVAIDGYLFLAKAGTGDIYNSDLDNPAAWTAGSFISSELYPDDVKALVKVNNYLLAIGTQGCEFFYDAAIAIGSPLAREEGSSLPFGTTLPYTIACNKNTVFLLANNNDGTAVFKVIEDKRHKDIPNTWLVPYLADYMATSSSTADNFRGYFIRHGSDLCYCFKNGTDLGCFVYSTATNMWTEYGSTIDFNGFPVDATAFSTSGALVTFVAGKYNFTTVFFGTLGYTLFSTGITSAPSTNTGVDYFNSATDPVQILHEIRPIPLDFGTLNVKTMSRMGAVVEKMNSSPNGESILLQVSWDDYDDSSTQEVGPYTINATGTNNYPFISQMGLFRQRRFYVRYSGNIGIRVKRFEFKINKGQQ